jgi:hypothetical protein
MTARKSATVLCGVEVTAGGELLPGQNIMNSDLTVPETPVPPPQQVATGDESSSGDELSTRNLLWIGIGTLLVLYVFLRFGLGRKKAS